MSRLDFEEFQGLSTFKNSLAIRQHFTNFKLILFAISLAILFGAILLSFDIVLEDISHFSIIQQFPLKTYSQYLKKSVVYVSIIGSLAFLSMLILTAYSYLTYDNWLVYPVPLYLNKFIAIDLWMYLLLFFVLNLFISFFIISLSIILNFLVQDEIITLTILTLCLVFSQINPLPPYRDTFSFFDYLNANTLLDGSFFQKTISHPIVYILVLLLPIVTLHFFAKNVEPYHLLKLKKGQIK